MSQDLLVNLFSSNTNFICHICKKYLTVLPIFYANDIGNICGRCTPQARLLSKRNTKYEKQTIFEALLKDYSFPCSNKRYGCQVDFIFGDDVVAHEKQCEFKKEICPLNYDFFNEEQCTWFGKTEDFVGHVEESHAGLIEQEPFKVILQNRGKNSICFNPTNLQFATIVIKYVKDSVYYFMVMLHGSEGDSRCYTIDLKIFDKNEETYLVLRKNSLESLRNLVNCFQSDFNHKMFKIDMNAIGVGHWRQPKDNVVVKFEIMKKSFIDLCHGPKTVQIISKDTQLILNALKCTKCALYMTDKILTCANNHSKCGLCKSNVRCSVCNSTEYTRDKTLEKLSSETFHCPNMFRGRRCDFVCDSMPIKIHEKVCKLRMIKCVYNDCDWTDSLIGLSAHFYSKHQNCLIQNNSIEKEKLSPESFKSKMIYANYLNVDSQTFLFYQKLENRNFHFNVSHYFYENARYNFVFRLFHDSQPDICITIPGNCVSYNEDNQLEGATVITSKMLSIFPSTDLKLALKIFKIEK